jgi:AcrR family transcriptional regulator
MSSSATGTTAKRKARAQEKGPSNRERILDVAEELFSRFGYHGVTIRDITQKAHVNVALAHYHFGSKSDLLRQVVERRADEYSRQMNESIDAVLAEAGGVPPRVEAVLDAAIGPAFENLARADAGWRHYVRLISALGNVEQEEEFLGPVQRYYFPIARKVVEALRLALPECREDEIFWSFYFMMAALSHILMDTKTLDFISDGKFHTSDLARIRTNMVSFFARGARPASTIGESDD